MANERILLSGSDWKLYYKDRVNGDNGAIDCSVPSNVEHAFMQVGLLPNDLYYGENVRLAEKFERYDYEFTKIFDIDDINASYRIVFEGVDTIAEYFLNGEKIGESDNMLVEHAFDLFNLKQTGNELKVKIYSTTLFNSEQKHDAYTTISWNNPDYVQLRRAGHTYGWDIMPRLVSAGIWKDVYLEKIKPTYLSNFYLTTREITEETAFLQACYEIESNEVIANDNAYTLTVKGALGDSVFEKSVNVYSKSNVIKFYVDNAKLWWPNGAGEPNLYDITVNLYKNGTLIDDYKFKFGIRTVKLSLQTELGEKDFSFMVNGEKLYMRGSNHVPLSPLHSEDINRVEKEFEIITDFKMNMVRCWGGNVYESDKFYDLADKNGVLIWQDFAFGCATYPQNENYYAKISIEAEKVIKRLRNHPCIALYAGDNELDSMHSEFGLPPSFNDISRKILPNAVKNHDPYRVYLPSSPFVTESDFNKYGTDAFNNTAEQHLWGPRDWFKSPYYKNNTAKFVSEIGIHGSVTASSIEKFIPKNELDNRFGDSWVLHSTDHKKDNARIKLLHRHILLTFGFLPSDYKTFAELSSYPHAEGFKFYLENSRFNRPYTTGMLLWNHLDGWPQFSEAFVDYYFNKKRGYNVIKRSFEPVLMGIKENNASRYELVVTNDTLKETPISYSVYDGETGDIYANGETMVKANSFKKVCVLKDIYFNQKLLIIKYIINGKTYYNHFITGFPNYTVSQFRKWYDILDSLN